MNRVAYIAPRVLFGVSAACYSYSTFFPVTPLTGAVLAFTAGIIAFVGLTIACFIYVEM